MMVYVLIGVAIIFVILLCVGLAIASFSGENFGNELQKAKGFRNTYGFTSVGFVGEINKRHFNNKLVIAGAKPHNDHYNGGVVSLSEETITSSSLASIATIAHELGHARQDFEGDTLKKHFRLRKAGRIVGLLFMPLLLSGVVLSALYFLHVIPTKASLIIGFVCLGISLLLFLFALFLKYREIAIEKQASQYAIEFLEEYLTDIEVSLCKDFLDSARLTYWADFFKALLGWTMLTSKNKIFY